MEELIGNWESTSLLGYSYLSINGGDNSYLIMVGGEEKQSFKLHSFEFKEQDISFTVTNLNESGESEGFDGLLIQNKLVIKPSAEGDESNMSFLPVGEIDSLRAEAITHLNLLRENEHNN